MDSCWDAHPPTLTKAPLVWFLSLMGHQTPGRVLVVPDFLHLSLMEATVGTLRVLELVYTLKTWSVSEVHRDVLELHVWGYVPTNSVNPVYLVCVFLNPVQSVQFITADVQFSSRLISRTLKQTGSTWSQLRTTEKNINTFIKESLDFFFK